MMLTWVFAFRAWASMCLPQALKSHGAFALRGLAYTCSSPLELELPCFTIGGTPNFSIVNGLQMSAEILLQMSIWSHFGARRVQGSFVAILQSGSHGAFALGRLAYIVVPLWSLSSHVFVTGGWLTTCMAWASSSVGRLGPYIVFSSTVPMRKWILARFVVYANSSQFRRRSFLPRHCYSTRA